MKALNLLKLILSTSIFLNFSFNSPAFAVSSSEFTYSDAQQCSMDRRKFQYLMRCSGSINSTNSNQLCSNQYSSFYDSRGLPLSNPPEIALSESEAKDFAGNWKKYMTVAGWSAVTLVGYAAWIGVWALVSTNPILLTLAFAVEAITWVTGAIAIKNGAGEALAIGQCKYQEMYHSLKELTLSIASGNVTENKTSTAEMEKISNCIKSNNSPEKLKPVLLEGMANGVAFDANIEAISKKIISSSPNDQYMMACMIFRSSAASIDLMMSNVICEGRDGNAVAVRIDGMKFHYFPGENLLRQLEGRQKEKSIKTWLGEKYQVYSDLEHKFLSKFITSNEPPIKIEKIPRSELDSERIFVARERIFECARQ